MSSPTLRVWDLPLRLFHGLLAVCISGSLITAWLGGFWMDYHLSFGYAACTLLLFRLGWGVVGSRTARFATFVKGPLTVLGYLRGAPADPGHNPLGSWSVVAMLVVLSIQAVTGLFANDGIFTEGPLASWVDAQTSDFLTGWHLRLEPVIYALIALHLTAIAWYACVHRKPLVRAMVTGDQPADELAPGPGTQDSAAVRWRALLLAAACIAAVSFIVAQGAGF